MQYLSPIAFRSAEIAEHILQRQSMTKHAIAESQMHGIKRLSEMFTLGSIYYALSLSP